MFILGGVCFWAWNVFQAKQLAMEDVLPEGAILYVEFSDIQKNLDQVKSSPLWQSISQMNFNRLAKEKIISPKQKAFIDSIFNRKTSLATNLLLTNLFDEQVAVAIYPTNINLTQFSSGSAQWIAQSMQDALSSIFIVTRIGAGAQTAELVTRFFNQYGASYSKETMAYQKHVINIVTLPKYNLQVSYVRIEDLLIFGIGDKSAKLSLNIYNKTKSSLAMDQDFQEIRRQESPFSDISIYFNFQELFAMLNKQFEGLENLAAQSDKMNNAQEVNVPLKEGTVKKQLREAKETFEGTLDQVRGFKSVGITTHLDDLTELKLNFFFNPNDLSPRFREMFACHPEENQSLSFIPVDVLGYQWGNCFNLQSYWDQIKEQIAESKAKSANQQEDGAFSIPVMRLPNMDEGLFNEIENNIIPSIGDEFGGYLTDIQLGGGFSHSQIVIFSRNKGQGKNFELIGNLNREVVFCSPE